MPQVQLPVFPAGSVEINRKRLTNPTYHFVADFAEVGG
jgi:hypothetical protein